MRKNEVSSKGNIIAALCGYEEKALGWDTNTAPLFYKSDNKELRQHFEGFKNDYSNPYMHYLLWIKGQALEIESMTQSLQVYNDLQVQL